MPLKNKHWPKNILAFFQESGSRGGKTRAARYTSEQLQEWGRLGGRPKGSGKNVRRKGTLAQIDHAAIDVVVATDAGKAVAEVDAAGNPRLCGGGGGDGRVGGRLWGRLLCSLLCQKRNCDEQSQWEPHLSNSGFT